MKSMLIAIILAGCSLQAQQAGSRSLEVSAEAAGILAQTDVARQALANHDTAAALGYVNQALQKVEKVERMAGGSQPLIVPLAGEFEGESTMVPAKRHSDRLKHNASVSEVTGKYTATTLNVSTARQQLEAARAALTNNDPSAADADLAAVQAAVVTKSFDGDLPLAQARENLALARKRVLDGKYKDAILPLKSAARALDRFARQAPRPEIADVAERMRIDIDAYAEHITHDHADALDRLAGWSDQVTRWFNSGMAQ
jgi:hypothetical protein